MIAKIFQYFGVNLTEDVRAFYDVHCKSLKKQRDIKRWKILACLWIGGIDINTCPYLQIQRDPIENAGNLLLNYKNNDAKVNKNIRDLEQSQPA